MIKNRHTNNLIMSYYGPFIVNIKAIVCDKIRPRIS